MGLKYQLPHCSHYCCIMGKSDSDPINAAELRGELFWRNVAKIRGRVHWLARLLKVPPSHTCFGDHTQWRIPGDCQDSLLFIVMPAHEQVLEIIRDFHDRHQVVIVDVTADVFRDGHPDDMPPDAVAAGKMVLPGAWDFWYQPKVQSILNEALQLSTVITTSWDHLVPFLRERTGYRIPVIHLPDLKDGNWGRFGLDFKHVYQEALKAREKSLGG